MEFTPAPLPFLENENLILPQKIKKKTRRKQKLRMRKNYAKATLYSPRTSSGRTKQHIWLTRALVLPNLQKLQFDFKGYFCKLQIYWNDVLECVSVSFSLILQGVFMP